MDTNPEALRRRRRRWWVRSKGEVEGAGSSEEEEEGIQMGRSSIGAAAGEKQRGKRQRSGRVISAR